MVAHRPCRKATIATFVLLLVGTFSAFGQEEGWNLIGSWTNKAYENSRFFAAKVVYGADGRMAVFQRLSDRSAIRLPYTVESDWIESGIHWFKIKYSDGHVTFCEIIKLFEDGNSLEAVGAFNDYPKEFDPSSKDYYHYSRQRESE